MADVNIEVPGVEITDELSAKLLKLGEQRLTAAKRIHDVLSSNWELFFDIYNGTDHPPIIEPGQPGYDGRSRLYTPYAKRMIDTMVPRFVDPEPMFAVEAYSPAEDLGAEHSTKLVKMGLERDGFVAKQHKLVWPAIALNLGIGKVVWEPCRRYKRVKKTIDPSLPLEGENTPGWEWVPAEPGRPSVTIVDPFDFFWDPAATDLEDCTFILHRSWVSPEFLRNEAKAGRYDSDRVEELIAKCSGGGSAAFTGNADVNGREERTIGRICIWEMHSGGQAMTVFGGTENEITYVLQHHDENPYDHGKYPFVVASSQPGLWTMHGQSELEDIRDLQKAMWASDNSRIDMINMALNPPRRYNPMKPELKGIVWGPGAEIPAAPGDFEILNNQGLQNAQALLGERQQHHTDMEQMTGVNDAIAGSSQTGSATEASNNLQEASRRLVSKLVIIQENLYAGIADLFLELYKQFLEDEIIIRVTGDDGAPDSIKVTADDIPSYFKIRVRTASESLQKAQEKQQLGEYITSMSPYVGVPQPDGMTINLTEAFEKFAKLNGLDPKRAVMQMPAPPEEPAADEMVEEAPAPLDGLPFTEADLMAPEDMPLLPRDLHEEYAAGGAEGVEGLPEGPEGMPLEDEIDPALIDELLAEMDGGELEA